MSHAYLLPVGSPLRKRRARDPDLFFVAFILSAFRHVSIHALCKRPQRGCVFELFRETPPVNCMEGWKEKPARLKQNLSSLSRVFIDCLHIFLVFCSCPTLWRSSDVREGGDARINDGAVIVCLEMSVCLRSGAEVRALLKPACHVRTWLYCTFTLCVCFTARRPKETSTSKEAHGRNIVTRFRKLCCDCLLYRIWFITFKWLWARC